MIVATARPIRAALRGARARDGRRRWLLGVALDAAAALRVWAAFHPAEYATRFELARAADARELRRGLGRGALRALLPQHFLLVTMVLAAQLVLCTLAAYAFARFEFPGRELPSRWCWCS